MIREVSDETPDSTCKACCLAESNIGSVTVCSDCGVVNLSLSNVSVRLRPGDFQELARMVAEAHINLNHLVEKILLASGQSSAADQFGTTRLKTH